MAMRVGFLGNCQAQCLQSWLMQLPDQIEIVHLPPVWLVDESSRLEVLAKIASCDLIFAQRLGNSFKLADLRTDNLKNEFRGKVVSWPNAYFDGYFPDIGYFYSTQGKIVGPLDDYHFGFIRESHAAGLDINSCTQIATTDAIFERRPDPIAHSLTCLAEREQALDITISDYVATHLANRRLFYSMNHPTNELLGEILQRLFGFVGERRRLDGIGPFGYPLNKIIIAYFPAIAKRHRLVVAAETLLIEGVEVKFSMGTYQVLPNKARYSFEQLVSTYYRCYDIIADR